MQWHTSEGRACLSACTPSLKSVLASIWKQSKTLKRKLACSMSTGTTGVIAASPLDTRFIWSQSATGETERRKMSNTCKWIMYKDGCSWYTECGHEQGCRIRPKQKKCYCGKTIERTKIDDLSPLDQAFINIIKGIEGDIITR